MTLEELLGEGRVGGKMQMQKYYVLTYRVKKQTSCGPELV